jgi:hypothetical protein
MAVRKDLKHTIRAAKLLKNFDKILGAVAESTRGRITKLWLKGFGADNRRFNKALNEKYAIRKGKSGRLPFRNLNFTGDMSKALSVRKSSNGYIIGWQDIEELDKARGNNKHAPNMMSVGKALQSFANVAANKLFWKGVNKA